MLSVRHYLLLRMFYPGRSQRGADKSGSVYRVQRGTERADAGDKKVKILQQNRTEKSERIFRSCFVSIMNKFFSIRKYTVSNT